jgi:hypothetical protein
MKKINLKYIFNDHSIERFFERTALNITKKDISKALTNNQITHFKRINVTRSMAYLKVKDEVIKIVIHRKKNKIITILPWKSIFHYRIKIQIMKFQNRIFRVNLYPDCYLETRKPNAMTKIFEYHGKDQRNGNNIYKKIRHDHPLFEQIFYIAWSFFETEEDHLKIKNERKAGNETFEIENKAKEIKHIVEFGINLPESHIIERT